MVVGYGGAGAAAAITAADLGASVVVLEKQPRATHMPSSRFGAIVLTIDDVEKATRYFDRCARGMVPVAVSRALAARTQRLEEWLDRIGGLRLERVRGARYPGFEGADALRVCLAVPRASTVKVEQRPDPHGVPLAPGSQRRNEDFFDALAAAVAARDRISVRWETPGTKLLTDGDGRVIGVEATSSSGTRRVRARRGVVLSCGGYGFDEELKLNYLKAHPFYSYGSPANTGDGVRMAQAAGADLWHMNQMMAHAMGHFVLEDGRSANTIIRLDPPGYVLTDKRGRRFADEYKQSRVIEHTFYFELIYYDAEMNDYPRIPCYWFFDRRRQEGGPIGRATAVPGLYTWSADNRAEIARGWISEGATIEAAAAKAGVLDPAEAARSVDAYNRACAEGSDAFGRPRDTLVPLDSGPFYCVPLYPGGPNTCGGPRRDERARILDPFGKPIPGLFGAGELGEAFGLLYPSSGSGLSEALCFGQIAAETAIG